MFKVAEVRKQTDAKCLRVFQAFKRWKKTRGNELSVLKMIWPPIGVFLVARTAFALVFLKSVCEMSNELLFANKIDISGKSDYVPVMCEQFYLQSLQQVKEKTHVVSLLEKPSLKLNLS